MDIYTRENLTEALMAYTGTLLLVTHDRHLMNSLACPILYLENGKATLYPSYDALMGRAAPAAAPEKAGDQPAKAGLVQAFGVFIDTIVICSCTAMIMLLVPEKMIAGLEGMELLQTAMNYHLGKFGVIFIAVTLFLFSFSTFLGILFYARGNVAYLLGDKWCWQTAYKILALVMLFIGGIAAYHIVWDLGDVGIGLMTIFNIVTLYPMGGEALEELRKYEKN